MGMRFRKSWNLGGLRINLSKKGVGGSVGTKGARYTVKAGGGTRKTVGIPGTGVSFVKESGKRKNNSNGYRADQSSGSRISYSKFAIVFKILGILLLIPSLLLALVSPVVGLVGIGISIICFAIAKNFKKKAKEQDSAVEQENDTGEEAAAN